MSVDVVGYSRLMGADDEATILTLKDHRSTIARLIDTFRGRVVDDPGDNLLAEFPSAHAAVRCALDVQRQLATDNEQCSEDRRMEHRIGIHLGDVVVDGSRIFGDGVNVAARLEALSEPGGVCLSDAVFQQVRRRLELAATDLGEQTLKNIEDAVHAYQLSTGDSDAQRLTPRAIAAAPMALEPPEQPSLAVLPFTNLSGDPTQDYFSDGLTLDILAELVRIPGLFLIGQDSSFTYRTTATKPEDVARELGVRHILEGSVRTAGNRVRITVRLLEASGRHVWAERYDRDIDDIFAVQDEITDQVVTALDIALVGGENARIMRRQVRNPQALGLAYQGLELVHRFTRDDMERARQLFREAITLEPDSPTVYAELAWTHYFDVERGWSEDPTVSLAEMAKLSQKALDLGDDSGYADLMLGHMHLMKREYEEALANSDRALGQRPSCQAAWGLKANILNYCGRPREAVPLAERSIRLSPVAQTFFPEVLATAHYLSGNFEGAIVRAHEALALAPDSVDARVVLIASLVETGRLDAARAAAREVESIDPTFTLSRFRHSRPYRDAATLEKLTASLNEAGLTTDAPGGAEVVEFSQPQVAARRRIAQRPRR
jgi:adenylate cyclase